MTSTEYIEKNGWNGKNRDDLGLAVGLQMKLQKHLALNDDSRVRDHIIAIRVLWPDWRSLPIDTNLIKKAAAFLKKRGWYLHFGEDHSHRVSGYITRHSNCIRG